MWAAGDPVSFPFFGGWTGRGGFASGTGSGHAASRGRLYFNAHIIAQVLGRKVGPIRPDERVKLGMNLELNEYGGIAQRFKDGAAESPRQIDLAARSVAKAEPHDVAGDVAPEYLRDNVRALKYNRPREAARTVPAGKAAQPVHPPKKGPSGPQKGQGSGRRFICFTPTSNEAAALAPRVRSAGKPMAKGGPKAGMPPHRRQPRQACS